MLGAQKWRPSVVALVVLQVAQGYFFLPDLLTWVKADAAADFCALVELGFESTLPAAEAALEPVDSHFLLNAIHLLTTCRVAIQSRSVGLHATQFG